MIVPPGVSQRHCEATTSQTVPPGVFQRHCEAASSQTASPGVSQRQPSGISAVVQKKRVIPPGVLQRQMQPRPATVIEAAGVLKFTAATLVQIIHAIFLGYFYRNEGCSINKQVEFLAGILGQGNLKTWSALLVSVIRGLSKPRKVTLDKLLAKNAGNDKVNAKKWAKRISKEVRRWNKLRKNKRANKKQVPPKAPKLKPVPSPLSQESTECEIIELEKPVVHDIALPDKVLAKIQDNKDRRDLPALANAWVGNFHKICAKLNFLIPCQHDCEVEAVIYDEVSPISLREVASLMRMGQVPPRELPEAHDEEEKQETIITPQGPPPVPFEIKAAVIVAEFLKVVADQFNKQNEPDPPIVIPDDYDYEKEWQRELEQREHATKIADAIVLEKLWATYFKTNCTVLNEKIKAGVKCNQVHYMVSQGLVKPEPVVLLAPIPEPQHKAEVLAAEVNSVGFDINDDDTIPYTPSVSPPPPAAPESSRFLDDYSDTGEDDWRDTWVDLARKLTARQETKKQARKWVWLLQYMMVKNAAQKLQDAIVKIECNPIPEVGYVLFINWTSRVLSAQEKGTWEMFMKFKYSNFTKIEHSWRIAEEAYLKAEAEPQEKPHNDDDASLTEKSDTSTPSISEDEKKDKARLWFTMATQLLVNDHEKTMAEIKQEVKNKALPKPANPPTPTLTTNYKIQKRREYEVAEYKSDIAEYNFNVPEWLRFDPFRKISEFSDLVLEAPYEIDQVWEPDPEWESHKQFVLENPEFNINSPIRSSLPEPPALKQLAPRKITSTIPEGQAESIVQNIEANMLEILRSQPAPKEIPAPPTRSPPPIPVIYTQQENLNDVIEFPASQSPVRPNKPNVKYTGPKQKKTVTWRDPPVQDKGVFSGQKSKTVPQWRRKGILKAQAEPKVLRDPTEDPDPDCAGIIMPGISVPGMDELGELTIRRSKAIFRGSDNKYEAKLKLRTKFQNKASKKPRTPKEPPTSPAYHPVEPEQPAEFEWDDIDEDIVKQADKVAADHQIKALEPFVIHQDCKPQGQEAKWKIQTSRDFTKAERQVWSGHLAKQYPCYKTQGFSYRTTWIPAAGPLICPNDIGRPEQITYVFEKYSGLPSDIVQIIVGHVEFVESAEDVTARTFKLIGDILSHKEYEVCNYYYVMCMAKRRMKYWQNKETQILKDIVSVKKYSKLLKNEETKWLEQKYLPTRQDSVYAEMMRKERRQPTMRFTEVKQWEETKEAKKQKKKGLIVGGMVPRRAINLGDDFGSVQVAGRDENIAMNNARTQARIARAQARQQLGRNFDPAPRPLAPGTFNQQPGVLSVPEADFEDPDMQDLPEIPAQPLSKKQQMAQRKREIMERDRIANESYWVEKTIEAKELNFPPFSDWLRSVYTRTISISKPVPLNFISFVFDWHQNLERARLPMAEQFREVSSGAEDFAERALQQTLEVYRISVTFISNETGQQHIISTQYKTSYSDAVERICDLLEQGAELYGNDRGIVTWELQVVPMAARIVGGNSNLFEQSIEHLLFKRKIEEVYGQLRAHWFVLSPSSKKNCLWTSVAILTGWENNPALLHNTHVQNDAGKGLKKRVGTENLQAGTEADIQKLADFKQVQIDLYDHTNTIISSYLPESIEEQPPVIAICLMFGHYHALIPKPNDQVSALVHTEEEKPQEAQPIEQLDRDFIAKEKRIVAYDLESFRVPISDTEVEQCAYAVGWAFEVKDESEKMALQNLGYTILEYLWRDKPMTVAYKQEVGEELNYETFQPTSCLDRALQQWMTQQHFHNAVFYAHNGGKFDIRLILGQSTLMFHPDFVIMGPKTIELNGRIICMEIQNKERTYDTAIKGKNNKTYNQKTQHTVQLKDSLILFGPDSSLGKLTTEMKVPHKKMEELVGIHTQMTKETWMTLWEQHNMSQYLQNDCVGLVEVLTQFNDEVKAATKIPITCVNTGASLAKKFYLQSYYQPSATLSSGAQIADDTKTIYTLTPEQDLFIRAGYGGGRCEAFVSKVWNGRVFYYDFTSLYPDAGTNTLPTGKPKFLVPQDQVLEKADYVKSMWQKRMVEGKVGKEQWFWQVKVSSPNAIAGNPTDPLKRKPLFGRKEKSMYVFRWYVEPETMVLFEPEIQYAMKEGLDYAFEPVNAICFKTSPVLAEINRTLFQKKAEAKNEGNDTLSKTWKIIINSLYGVWGLKTLGREGIEIATPEMSSFYLDLATGKLLDVKEHGNYLVTRREHDLEVTDCNVAVAAAVTTYARIKLYQLLSDIQDKGGVVLYCDTDSVITNYCIEEDRELAAKWIGPSGGEALGSLKNEVDECYQKYNKKNPENPLPPTKYFDECVIVAPKLYMVQAANGKIRKKAHKGYRENPETGDLVTMERMCKLVDTSIPQEERVMHQSTVQWLGGNRDMAHGNIGVRNVIREKSIKQVIRKGIPNEEGHIQPFISGETMANYLEQNN